MPEQANIQYFLKRAEQERARAAKAGNNTAAIRHFELAEQYEDRANGRGVEGTIPVRG